MYKPLPVNDAPRIFYIAIRGYALLDDITDPDAPDLKVNELFGLKLNGQGWGELGGTHAMIGTLSNNQGVMIKLVGLEPYGHWNYNPPAADAWAFSFAVPSRFGYWQAEDFPSAMTPPRVGWSLSGTRDFLCRMFYR